MNHMKNQLSESGGAHAFGGTATQHLPPQTSLAMATVRRVYLVCAPL